ncbi:MAG: hypothetical protein IKW79_01655, partial [Schwartzia sp.]|nr:hypothetical protein [Schwartzia sp. (in: firmicutes)]
MAITVKVWRQRSKNTQKTQKGGSADRKKDIAYRRQIAELWNMESVKTIAKMHQRGLGKAAKV